MGARDSIFQCNQIETYTSADTLKTTMNRF